MIRKMMLLTGMALALVAFAAPAVASAELWYSQETEEPLPEETESEVGAYTAKGMLTLTLGGLTTPCEVELAGFLWNDETVGTGSVLSLTLLKECQTNIMACKVEKLTAPGLPENPWKLKITALNKVDVSNITMQYHYTAGCEPFIGKPNLTTSVAGTAKSTFNNNFSALEWNEAGELKQESNGAAVKLDGELKIEPKVFIGP
ncbi:MAG TPA: hypothetical protein VGO66_04915 [Solirubrobacterales bacterium]|jgi:hypothetical protein|nr:hypothetical protein [Solirubrobacterales bacterium]